MSTMKIILRRGLAADLPKADIAQGEVCFNIDTRELMVGTGDGDVVKVADVVEGPDGALYHPTPEGYIPLCIKGLPAKQKIERIAFDIEWPDDVTVLPYYNDIPAVRYNNTEGKQSTVYPEEITILEDSLGAIKKKIDKIVETVRSTEGVASVTVGAKAPILKNVYGELYVSVFVIGLTKDPEYVYLRSDLPGSNSYYFYKQRLQYAREK